MPPTRTPRDAAAPETSALGPDVDALAHLYGAQTGYRTAVGAWRRADPDALLAVLRALGAPLERLEEAPDALRAAKAERARELLPPAAVAWQGRAASVTLHASAGKARSRMRCHLVTEAGDAVEWDGDVRVAGAKGAAAAAPAGARAAGTGARVARAEASGASAAPEAYSPAPGATLDLPGDLPIGYHHLDVALDGRQARCRVIVAPERAWSPEGEGRGWGAFLPLYALRSERSWGTGDLTDLAALERWVAGLGGEMVGTLPILASFLDDPFEPSPYAPVSRLFWNEIYLDPERAPGWGEAEEAQRILASQGVREALGHLRDSPRVDYREAARLKRRVVEALATCVAPANEPLPGELAVFAEAQAEALSYARFRAAGERRGGGWRTWPAPARDGALREGDYEEEAVRYHLYAQWAMERALERLGGQGAGLCLDLPLGTHADGFDTWRFRGLFAEGASVGAPPDALSADGQDWGIAPVLPERSREGGHAYWAASLRALMGASAMLRLDHVMGMHRLYWVPRGFPPTEGVYVRYPEEELYAVVCLESHRQRCEVVGEDLGTVPLEVRESMARHGLRRMYVLRFEEEDAPVPASAVASLGTHDTPTWAGTWEGERARPPLRDGLRFLAESSARLVFISLEDLWGETEPQNRPGTTDDANWRRKAALDLEDMEAAQEARAILREVDALRRASDAADHAGAADSAADADTGAADRFAATDRDA